MKGACLILADHYAARIAQGDCCACSGARYTALPLPLMHSMAHANSCTPVIGWSCEQPRGLSCVLACSNPAFEADGGDPRAKRTSSDWGSVSLSRTGSPTKGPTAASALPRRCSEELGGSWIRPAATSAFHSRTGSVLSEWADSEGVSTPVTFGLSEFLMLLRLGISAGNSGVLERWIDGYEMQVRQSIQRLVVLLR